VKTSKNMNVFRIHKSLINK